MKDWETDFQILSSYTETTFMFRKANAVYLSRPYGRHEYPNFKMFCFDTARILQLLDVRLTPDQLSTTSLSTSQRFSQCCHARHLRLYIDKLAVQMTWHLKHLLMSCLSIPNILTCLTSL